MNCRVLPEKIIQILKNHEYILKIEMDNFIKMFITTIWIEFSISICVLLSDVITKNKFEINLITYLMFNLNYAHSRSHNFIYHKIK